MLYYFYFLDQVIQSDNELYFENDFIIHLKIVGTQVPGSSKVLHISSKCIQYLSKECQLTFFKFMEYTTNFNQLKLVKRGLIDINYILANDNDKDCLLLSIFTGYIYNQCCNDY